MKEKAKPNERPKKENGNRPRILSANLDKIMEKFISKCFEIGLVQGYIFFSFLHCK